MSELNNGSFQPPDDEVLALSTMLCEWAWRIQEIAAETGLSVESVRLFSWIEESDGWTADAAHKAFGHLAADRMKRTNDDY
jgi:hypothetical protein